MHGYSSLGTCAFFAVNIYMVACCDMMAYSFFHVNINVPEKSAASIFGVSTRHIPERCSHNSAEGISIIQGIHKRMVQFQTLTRNLFLTLHGHNVHRQQRQLSKFLMRYQQFAFHTYCGAAGSFSKMASQQEKDFMCAPF